MSQTTPLRVLCFGDSLTSGYSNFGISSFPYGDTLRDDLETALRPRPVTVDVNGFPGDLVAAGFLRRLRRACETVKAEPYDWIVILGGTNDLGWGNEPEGIYEHLKTVWSFALSTGAQVLALDVFETAGTQKSAIRARDSLNTKILAHQEPRFHTFELSKVIRYHDTDEKTRELVWNDSVHLNEYGYEVMGRAIAQRLLELLKEGV